MYNLSVRQYFRKTDRYKKVLKVQLQIREGWNGFLVELGNENYGIEISEKGAEMARKNGVKCYQLDIDEEDFSI